MGKIVFFNMNQLGDLLFSLPAIKAARQESNVNVISVTKSTLAPLLTASGLVNEVIDKNSSVFKIALELRKKKVDKAILFSESPSSLLAAFFSGVKERIGFKTASLNFLLTKKAGRLGVPSLCNNNRLALLDNLKNIKKDYTDILTIPQGNIDNIKKWFRENALDPKKTIAFSTGASKRRRDKCLSSDIWVEVIDVLTSKGFNCILSGAKWEKEELNAISQKCKSKPQIFAAESGILDSAAFLKTCFLFIGIDSGAMHLAAAVGTKCIGIFGHTDPKQVGPMPLEKHIIIKNEDISKISAQDIILKVK